MSCYFLVYISFSYFLVHIIASFWNLDSLRTSGTHRYTLRIFFEHFDIKFLLFGIKALLFNSLFIMSCSFLVYISFSYFLVHIITTFCNLESLKTSSTHGYTLSIFFEHFDNEFPLFGIKALLFIA